MAIKATKLFFDGIRKDVGDQKFAKFLNMEALRTLSFAIDTTGSMSGKFFSRSRFLGGGGGGLGLTPPEKTFFGK